MSGGAAGLVLEDGAGVKGKQYLPRMDGASVKDDIESLFKDVVFMVEATHNEQHNLWLTHFEVDVGYGKVKSWEQEMAGHTCIIGEFGEMPINLCFFYAKIEGRRVCFWECVSAVSHVFMIEKWMEPRTAHMRWDAGTRPALTNADNFHHCLDAIRQLNKL